jgi:hypothetical protein
MVMTAEQKEQYSFTLSKHVVVILTKAQSLIVKGWCQGDDAQNSKGATVSPTARTAVQFCPRGAIFRAVHLERRKIKPFEDEMENQAVEFLEEELRGPGDIMEWNDDEKRKKTQVVTLFSSAIKRAAVTYRKLLKLQQRTKAVAAKNR